MTEHTYIDLFSGSGGLGLGFEEAGFKNVFSVEFNQSAADTYKYNFPNNKLFVTDIKNLSSESILSETKNKVIDVIVGGPPCQGFSIAGNIGRKFIDDKRNHLFKEFVRVVKIVKPKMFVMENVARMATHNKGKTIKEICSAFSDLGYDVQYKVLNAVNYEVPQNRRRIFIVGTTGQQFSFPTPSGKILTVKDAIGDLPPLKSGESSSIPNHNAMNHTKQMLEKMSFVKDGGNRNDIPERLRPKSGDVRKYIRYDSHKPSVTITGDMRKVFHYSQNRALTPRELARIQTFPDDFIFKGSSISIQQQIGNAVPPRLAKAVAMSVRQSLSSVKKVTAHKYPKVNYIGNKEKLSEWIIDNIPKDTHKVLDLFAGGGSISYALKKHGYQVISNDSLYSSFVINKAINENSHVLLPEDTIDKALKYTTTSSDMDLVKNLSNKLYFENEIPELAKLVGYSFKLTGYEKYLYLALLRRAMIRKLPYSRMNVNWKNIKLLRNEDYSYKKYKRKRAYHNLPFSYHMKANLPSYNAAIFDNGKKNIASQANALDAIKKYSDVDTIYMDPPYPSTMNNYQGFYGPFDDIFHKEIKYTDLTNSHTFLEYLENLVSAAANYAKYVLISINSRSKPSYKDIINMCSFYGDVKLKKRKHNYQVSGKIEKNKNKEMLIVITMYR